MLENGRPRGRVPRQQSVTSASPLPVSPLRSSVSPQVASARYVKQFQALLEHQRQIFDEERALWNTERTELHEKIAQLEGSLRRYQAISSSQVSSPIYKRNSTSQSDSSFWGFLGKDVSNHTSATSSTGDEIWRGPKPDVQPTRTFSDPTTQSTKSGARDRLPSIAEDTTCGRRDSSGSQTGFHKPSVSGAELDKNLDGINFKSSTLSPVPFKKVMTPQSPSPRTSSPSRLSPRTIQLLSSDVETPLDPYTRDAGHTPLARRTYFDVDGTSNEGDGATPTQPEVERPPLEPHVSFARRPSERSDSYFPVAEEDSQAEDGNSRDGGDKCCDEKENSSEGKDESRDEDPELKGPLGLDNSQAEDKKFLNELDSKLLQASRSAAFSPPNPGSDKSDHRDNDEKDFEEPEQEPKLRIKRSMNFGSAFGAKRLGKGI